MGRVLALDPVPEAAGEARRFVVDELRRLGLSALIEPARLATSELVTNVVLHARTPFRVEVVAGEGGARIAVSDRAGPLPTPVAAHVGTQTVTTFGRGLAVVAALARRWGVAALPGGAGKTVWFEPRPDSEVSADQPSSISEVPGASVPSVEGELVDVWLIDMPLRMFITYRTFYLEMVRELTLMSMADHDPAGESVAHRLVRQAREYDRYLGFGVVAPEVRRTGRLIGDQHGYDVRYRLPRSAGPVCGQLHRLLEEGERFCEQERMLALATDQQGRALRTWFLTEIRRQLGGAPPRPWRPVPGPVPENQA